MNIQLHHRLHPLLHRQLHRQQLCQLHPQLLGCQLPSERGISWQFLKKIGDEVLTPNVGSGSPPQQLISDGTHTFHLSC